MDKLANMAENQTTIICPLTTLGALGYFGIRVKGLPPQTQAICYSGPLAPASPGPAPCAVGEKMKLVDGHIDSAGHVETAQTCRSNQSSSADKQAQ